MRHNIRIELKNDGPWMRHSMPVIKSYFWVEAETPEDAVQVLRAKYEKKGFEVLKCEPEKSPFKAQK